MRLIDLDDIDRYVLEENECVEYIHVEDLYDAPVITFEGLTEYLEDLEEEIENLHEELRLLKETE